MSSVDDRIVNMKFNNSQFGQGVDKTKRDLTGLEQAVTNVGKSKGMTSLGAAADGVRVKFSALQVAGTAALATIATKATMAAGNLVKKFTIQPILDGFNEYTTNLDSVQTIMANTGKSVGTVNKSLGELNDYSDQTIYNFSQMAKNIGTFTAAGVKLGPATSAIKGISNLAALSGSNATQASTAMYQLSQAIAAGRVGLQDWNSVVNAGMGGKVFKNALAQTAVAMGDLSEGAVKVGTDVKIMGASFRESISAQGGSSWLTSDVLVSTLAQLDGRFSRARMAAEGIKSVEKQNIELTKARQELAKQDIVFSDKQFQKMVKNADAAYAAATQVKSLPQLIGVVQESIGSMWANAFQIILGDFKQSKELWGAVGEEVQVVIDGISGTFLNALRVWEERGGRESILGGLKNIFGSLLEVMKVVAKAWDAAFPDSKVSLLNKFSKGFEKFTQYLVPSKEALEDIGTIFEAIFSVVHLGVTIFRGAIGGISAFIHAFLSGTSGARGGALSFVASIAEVIIAVEDWLTSGNRLMRFLKGIGELAGAALSPIATTISLLVDGFASLISGEGLGGAVDSFNKAKEVFGSFTGDILKALDKITAPLDPIKSKIAELATAALKPFQGFFDMLGDVRDRLVDGFGSGLDGAGDALTNFKEKIAGIFSGGINLDAIPFEKIGAGVSSAIAAIQEFAASLDISGKIDALRESVSNLWDDLFGGGGEGGGGGGSVMTSSLEGTTSAFEKVKDVFGSIWNGIKAVGNVIAGTIEWIVNAISNIPFPDDALEWATVLNYIIGGAIIKKMFFSKGVFDQIKDTIEQIGESASGALDQLSGTLQSFQTAVKAELIKSIAIAVGVLAASLLVLSFIPAENLGRALGALSAIMLMAGLATFMLSKSIDLVDEETGKLDVKDIGAKATALLALGAAMMLMAIAVAILTVSVLALAFVPWQKLAVGLAAVLVLMGALVLSFKTLEGAKGSIIGVGAAMLLMAIAINILVAAVIVLGNIPFDVLVQGMLALAVIIFTLTIAFSQLGAMGPNMFAAGAAMIMAAVAINILVSAIQALGSMPLNDMLQGLFAFVFILGMLVGALTLLSLIQGSVLASSTAILILAVALRVLMETILIVGQAPWQAIALGLGALTVALIILLAAAFVAAYVSPGLIALSNAILLMGIAVLAAGAGVFLFATGLSILAAVGTAAFAVITVAIQAFLALLPSIATQIAAAFVQFLNAIALAAPKIRKSLVTIIDNMLGTVRDLAPKFGKTFDVLVATGVRSLEKNIPNFVELGFTIIDKFLKSANDHVPSIVDSAVALVNHFLDELGDNADELANSGLQLIIDTINGITAAVEERGDEVRAAAENLAKEFADQLAKSLASFLGGINPTNYLPDISVSQLKSLLPGVGKTSMNMGGKSAKDGPSYTEDLRKAIADSATVISNAIKLLVGAAEGPLYDLMKAAKDLERSATMANTKAAASRSAADAVAGTADAATGKAKEARKKAKDLQKEADTMKGKAKINKDGKGINKKGKAVVAAEKADKEADKKEKAATKAQKQAKSQERIARQNEQAATIAQNKADYESARARDAVTYKDDAAGLGDSRAQAGSELADKASNLAAQAQAKVDEASRLEKLAAKGGKNAKKMQEEAARLRREAADETAQALELAKQSAEAQAEAAKAYAKARKEAAEQATKQILDIREQQKLTKAAREWSKTYELANDETKIKMLNDRVTANQNAAAAAQLLLDAAYAESDRLNAQIAMDPESVTKAQLDNVQTALANAEKASAEVDRALDAVEQDQQTIRQIEDKTAQQSTTNGGNNFTPSRTALEDAALAVDRFSASVAQAEELALAGASTTQFVQNNYSPEALSASAIYRQTNNLIAAAEVKMGV